FLPRRDRGGLGPRPPRRVAVPVTRCVGRNATVATKRQHNAKEKEIGVNVLVLPSHHLRAAVYDEAIAAFAAAYADQPERDHALLVAAVKNGRVRAETGV